MSKAAEIIEVGMGEMKVASAPDMLVTRGLGSCLGIVLYDPLRKMGGLAHPMLPILDEHRGQNKPAKYVDSVIILMIYELQKENCRLKNIIAKLFGGAHMFSSIPSESPFNIGSKNIKVAREKLDASGIKIVSEDVGENYGRTITFNLETGMVEVKTAFHGRREL